MNTGVRIIHGIRRAAVGVLLFCLWVIMPVMLYDHYYQMAFTKWMTGLMALAITLPVIALCSLILLFAEKKKSTWGLKDRSLQFAGLFLIAMIVTFGICNDKAAAWMGVDGWYMGVVAQVLLVFTLVACSGEALSEKVLTVFLLGGTLVPGITAICQRAGKDIFHLYWEMPDEVQRDYISTIGNRTWFSGWFCAIFPLAIWLYIREEKKWKQTILALYLIMSFSCLIVTFSDSGIFALAFVLFATLFLSLRRREYFTGALQVFFLVPFSGLLMAIVRSVSTGIVREARGVSRIFLHMGLMSVLLVAMAVLVMLTALKATEKVGDAIYGFVYKYRRVLFWVPVAGLGALIVFIALNTAGTFGEPIGGSYLLFDNYWGDGRGTIWRVTVQMYKDLPLKNKLFGVGQDCFAIHAYQYEAYSTPFFMGWGNSIITNAHNEFLNGLLTFGLVGTLAYVGLFLAGIRAAFSDRAARTSRVEPGIGLCLVGYLSHNFFCYQQIMAVLPVFALMGVGVALRKKNGT